MGLLPFSLVFISAFAHAYWNILIKRSSNKYVFTSIAKALEVVLFLPIAIFYYKTSCVDSLVENADLIAGAALITLLNYYSISSAYRFGEMSFVYPISRSGILFIPMLSFFLIGEKLSILGSFSVVTLLAGTFLLILNSSKILKTKFNLYTITFALLAAFLFACYTLLAKISVARVEPFFYYYGYTVLVALFYFGIVIVRYPVEIIRKEWKNEKSAIIQVGFLNGVTFMLILTALTMSKATYVLGVRQLSIAIGAYLAYRLLGEIMNKTKIIGLAFILTGVLLLVFS